MWKVEEEKSREVENRVMHHLKSIIIGLSIFIQGSKIHILGLNS